MATPENVDNLLTIKDVARRWKVSEKTVGRAVRRGQIQSLRIDHQIRFLPSVAPVQLLTISELAEQLQVSTRTIRRLISKGLPVHRFGDLPRFNMEEVRAYLSTQSE